MKVKLLAVLLLLCCAQVARGQCSNGPCYTATQSYSILTPAQEAQRGGMTATFSVKGPSGIASHNLVLTANSQITYIVATNNAASVSTTISQNGGAPTPWTVPPLNGSWSGNASPLGNFVMTLLASDGHGGTTQDIIHVTVISGTPGIIVSQDSLDTNFYHQITISGGGGSMLNDFTMCQGGNQQHCINATHTPYTTLTLKNLTSGEVQTNPQHQSGNIARSNESVSFTDTIAISFLPARVDSAGNVIVGDSFDFNETDEVICSLSGPIGVAGGGDISLTPEIAFTKAALTVPSNCKQILNSAGAPIGLQCDVAPYASAKSVPCDWQPRSIFNPYITDPAKMPVYWDTLNFGFAVTFGSGTNETFIWFWPFSVLQTVLINMHMPPPWELDITPPAWESDSSEQDCTNMKKGIHPWRMPHW